MIGLKDTEVHILVGPDEIPNFQDMNNDIEPNTTSCYIECIGNRWFSIFVRIPREVGIIGNLFVLRVFLDKKLVKEVMRPPGCNLRDAPQPEGEAGFRNDVDLKYFPEAQEVDWAEHLQKLDRAREEQAARTVWQESTSSSLIEGYISGELMRFPYVVQSHNQHPAGDVTEWDGKEIVMQLSQAQVVEEPGLDWAGVWTRGKIETVGDVFAFVFKYRPKQILKQILNAGQTSDSSAMADVDEDATLSDSSASSDSDRSAGHREALVRQNRLVERHMSHAQQADAMTARPTSEAAEPALPHGIPLPANPSHLTTSALPGQTFLQKKHVWDRKAQESNLETADAYAARMLQRRVSDSRNPSDKQWLYHLALFNNKELFCCGRVFDPPSKGVTWCDNAHCKVGTFHFECVNLEDDPRKGYTDLWFCPMCKYDEGKRVLTTKDLKHRGESWHGDGV